MSRPFARLLLFVFALLLLPGLVGEAAADPFGDWVKALRQQAAAQGISKPTLDAGSSALASWT